MMTSARQALAGRARRAWNSIFSELHISRPDGPPVTEVTEAGGLMARCHRAWPDDPAFLSQWEDLLSQSPAATPFHCPTWQREGLGCSIRTGTLRLITVHRDHTLIAVLPLELTPQGFLDTPGYAVSDYLDPLMNGRDDVEAWRMIVRLLVDMWDRELKAVSLYNIRQSASCRAVLHDVAAQEGLACEEQPISSVARVRLSPTWDEYLAPLDGHDRKELKRKMRRAESAGGRFLVVDHTNYDDRYLQHARDLIDQARPEKRDWCRAHLFPLLERIGPTLAREGRMRLFFLLMNDKSAACLIDLPSPRGPLIYGSGFDPSQAEYSPGIVVMSMALRHAVEGRCPVFDLLRGGEGYKYKFGAVDEPLFRISLHR